MHGRPDSVPRVLGAYFRDGQLITMPRRGNRRKVVLEHLAQLFEPGVRYSEVEVNRILRPVWDDVAALRRYLPTILMRSPSHNSSTASRSREARG